MDLSHQVIDSTTIELICKSIYNFNSLQELYLNFENCELAMSDLELLFSIFPENKNLEILSINFSNNFKKNEECKMDYLVDYISLEDNLEYLKYFNLNLTGCLIDQLNFENLLLFLNLVRNIEKFEFYLDDTSYDNNQITRFFSFLPKFKNLKSIFLDYSKLGLERQNLEILGKNLNFLKDLINIDINLNKNEDLKGANIVNFFNKIENCTELENIRMCLPKNITRISQLKLFTIFKKYEKLKKINLYYYENDAKTLVLMTKCFEIYLRKKKLLKQLIFNMNKNLNKNLNKRTISDMIKIII